MIICLSVHLFFFLSFSMIVCLSVHLFFFYLSIWSSVFLFICFLSVSIILCLTVHLSLNPSTFFLVCNPIHTPLISSFALPIHFFVCLPLSWSTRFSACLPILLFICLPVCLCFCPSRFLFSCLFPTRLVGRGIVIYAYSLQMGFFYSRSNEDNFYDKITSEWKLSRIFGAASQKYKPVPSFTFVLKVSCMLMFWKMKRSVLVITVQLIYFSMLNLKSPYKTSRCLHAFCAIVFC